MNWNQLSEHFTFLPEQIDFQNQNKLSAHYKVSAPHSYTLFLEYFGAGTLGDFFHFHPLGHMNTHRERLEPYLDDELNEMIDEHDSGDILIFADTDNGDRLGWKLDEMRGEQEPRIYEIPTRTFNVEEYARDIKDLIITLIQNPPDHLTSMKLTHLKRCL